MLRSESTVHARESPSNWGQLAAHLLEVEKSLSWGETHSSLSSWLADQAKQMKRGEATLWRALAAGRHYNELRAELASEGVDAPPLSSPELAASPESLELADKICRVAPAELVRSITSQVLRGTISRRELRAYWETYRPVLQGQTARGRNVAAPRFNPRSIDMISSRLEADCIAGLLKDGGAWLGAADAPVYKVIHMGDVDITAPDVIVLFRPNRISPLEIHGIEVTLRVDANAYLRRYKREGGGLDRLWAVTPMDAPSTESKLPTEIGLLEADPSGVRVNRQAGVAKQNGDELTRTLRSLLAREVGA